MFLLIDRTPNKSPEPTAVGAVSSASRLDDFWSRMAQLRMLDGFKFVRFSKSATVSERQKSSAIFRRLISLSHSAQGLHLFCQPGAAFSQV